MHHLKLIPRGLVALSLLAVQACDSQYHTFTSERWKDGDGRVRKAMLSDLEQRVLQNGMTSDECHDLLGQEDDVWGALWGYVIDAKEPRDPTQPIELRVYAPRSAWLVYDGPDVPRNRSKLEKLASGQLAAATAIIVNGGIERWCANEEGDRLELAEAVWAAVNHAWPAEASLEELYACADFTKQEWVYYTAGDGRAYEYNLHLQFESGVLVDSDIWEDH